MILVRAENFSFLPSWRLSLELAIQRWLSCCFSVQLLRVILGAFSFHVFPYSEIYFYNGGTSTFRNVDSVLRCKTVYSLVLLFLLTRSRSIRLVRWPLFESSRWVTSYFTMQFLGAVLTNTNSILIELSGYIRKFGVRTLLGHLRNLLRLWFLRIMNLDYLIGYWLPLFKVIATVFPGCQLKLTSLFMPQGSFLWCKTEFKLECSYRSNATPRVRFSVYFRYAWRILGLFASGFRRLEVTASHLHGLRNHVS